MRQVIVLFLLVALYSATAIADELADRRITVQEARALVMASLTREESRMPKIEAEHFDDPDDPSPKFLIFTIVWQGLPKGSVVAGMYAVDPYTGDVFLANKECAEVKNERLERLQARIRARLHLSRTEYRRLKTKGPLCEQ